MIQDQQCKFQGKLKSPMFRKVKISRQQRGTLNQVQGPLEPGPLQGCRSQAWEAGLAALLPSQCWEKNECILSTDAVIGTEGA